MHHTWRGDEVLEITIVAVRETSKHPWSDRHLGWNSSDEVDVELEDSLDTVGAVLVAVVLQYARILKESLGRWGV
jgi:hypothetical protein